MTPVDVSRPAGSYPVVVRKVGYDPYRADIALQPGQDLNLRATLLEHHDPITKTWWFWAGAALVVSGGITATYFLTRSDPEAPPYDGGTTGWVAKPAAFSF